MTLCQDLNVQYKRDGAVFVALSSALSLFSCCFSTLLSTRWKDNDDMEMLDKDGITRDISRASIQSCLFYQHDLFCGIKVQRLTLIIVPYRTQKKSSVCKPYRPNPPSINVSASRQDVGWSYERLCNFSMTDHWQGSKVERKASQALDKHLGMDKIRTENQERDVQVRVIQEWRACPTSHLKFGNTQASLSQLDLKWERERSIQLQLQGWKKWEWIWGSDDEWLFVVGIAMSLPGNITDFSCSWDLESWPWSDEKPTFKQRPMMIDLIPTLRWNRGRASSLLRRMRLDVQSNHYISRI